MPYIKAEKKNNINNTKKEKKKKSGCVVTKFQDHSRSISFNKKLINLLMYHIKMQYKY